MTAELRRGLILAILGLLAGFVVVAVFLGDGRLSLGHLAQDWRALVARDPAAPDAARQAASTASRLMNRVASPAITSRISRS